MRSAWLILGSLLVPLTVAVGQESDCKTPTCEGHKAGYTWAWGRVITEEDCDTAGENTNSPSFAEGCKAAVTVKQRFAPVDTTPVVDLLRGIGLGEQVAKDARLLPEDCQELYDGVTKLESKTDITMVATGFRNGCLEVARKQAKRILEENTKQAKAAAKQLKK